MRAAAFALLTLSVAIGLHAQDRPQFRSSTRLVQVSVAVEARDGLPVAGLTANDFRIFDDGQEQQIELFLVHGDTAAARGAEGATAAPSATAPLQFNNRLERGGSASVILFDRLNTPADDQLYARDNLIRFLAQIRPDDRVGIYVLESDGIHVLHDFTNDARSLLGALSRYRAWTSNEAADASLPELAGTGDAALDARLSQFLDRANTNIKTHFAGLRTDVTIEAFQGIAKHLAAIEGRKNLIWITAGFPLQAFTERGTNTSTAVRQATRPLNDANVTLYAIDARGLIGALTYARGAPASTTIATVQANVETLRTTTAETGGRAFFNTNDINGAVRRALDDARLTYILGYYPAHGKWNGAYRQIKVQLNRPGVQLRHRKGYLAVAASARANSDDSIRSALLSPLAATELELSARIERSTTAPGNLSLTVTTAPGAVSLEPAGEYWEGVLDVVIAQKMADGSTTRNTNQRLNLSLTRDRYEATRTRGFRIDSQVALAPGVQTLHIIVHDASTGTTGSIVIPATKLR